VTCVDPNDWRVPLLSLRSRPLNHKTVDSEKANFRGASDAAYAGFVAGLAHGLRTSQALLWSYATAQLMCSQPKAQLDDTSMATLEEVRHAHQGKNHCQGDVGNTRAAAFARYLFATPRRSGGLV
jgi:hypothetical protein